MEYQSKLVFVFCHILQGHPDNGFASTTLTLFYKLVTMFQVAFHFIPGTFLRLSPSSLLSRFLDH